MDRGLTLLVFHILRVGARRLRLVITHIGLIEFQRNSIPKPRVRATSYPGSCGSVLPTLKRVAPFEFGKDATAIAVEINHDRFPRVARASQPWAGGCNPFRDCQSAAKRDKARAPSTPQLNRSGLSGAHGVHALPIQHSAFDVKQFKKLSLINNLHS